MKKLSIALLVLAFNAHAAVAGNVVTTNDASAETSPSAPAQNTHKERDHRFKQCKAEALQQGVVKADLQTFMAACLNSAPAKN